MSPFESFNPSKRYIAALEMIMIREDEISTLRDMIDNESDPATKRVLITRLRASVANLKSWESYYKSKTPRVKGATVRPRT